MKSQEEIYYLIENNHFIKRAGVLVYKIENLDIKYLLVSIKENINSFILPQGHVEVNETYEKTALRETKEEAGILVLIEKELGYFFHEDKQGIKQTYIYLAKHLEEVKKEENRVVRWVTYEESKAMDIPRETRRFIEESDRQLKK